MCTDDTSDTRWCYYFCPTSFILVPGFHRLRCPVCSGTGIPAAANYRPLNTVLWILAEQLVHPARPQGQMLAGLWGGRAGRRKGRGEARRRPPQLCGPVCSPPCLGSACPGQALASAGRWVSLCPRAGLCVYDAKLCAGRQEN